MAGLSITRRRKAWLRGVACGASGKGKCMLRVPKLKDIFQRGLAHGRTNVDSPYVKAILEQEHRRRKPRTGPTTFRSIRANSPRANSPRGPERRRSF